MKNPIEIQHRIRKIQEQILDLSMREPLELHYQIEQARLEGAREALKWIR